MDFALAGHRIVLTGGGSGIGHAAVDFLLRCGATVSTCARDLDRLRESWRDLDPETARRLHLFRCDVFANDQVGRFAFDAARAMDGIDGLVVNANSSSGGDAPKTTASQYSKDVNQNIAAAAHPIMTTLPYLRRSECPRIVIVDGVAGRTPDPALASRSSAPAALGSYTTSLSFALAKDRIGVNRVRVGVIDTPHQRERHRESGSELSYEDWLRSEAAKRRIPYKRVGTPSEVAGPIAFLLSPLSSYMTGTALDVSGGK
ncbi:SDR family oxidoreductase [Salininema proteolyticum]|uniref:SDR family oxidoreductase n=1 Tax=Salininema proteolyticum TaxID=1607685 RepID=A0ABV8TW06_9ACTN